MGARHWRPSHYCKAVSYVPSIARRSLTCLRSGPRCSMRDNLWRRDIAPAKLSLYSFLGSELQRSSRLIVDEDRPISRQIPRRVLPAS